MPLSSAAVSRVLGHGFSPSLDPAVGMQHVPCALTVLDPVTWRTFSVLLVSGAKFNAADFTHVTRGKLENANESDLPVKTSIRVPPPIERRRASASN